MEALVAKLDTAIRAAAGVALATAVLVLAGALAANARARLMDAVTLKILGATRGRLIAASPGGICDARGSRRRRSASARARFAPM